MYGANMNDIKKINRIVDTLIRSRHIGSERRDTARLVVGALLYGSNVDKLANVLEINRDNVARPVARRMRENGLWTRGKTGVSSKTGDELALEVVLHVGCADGLLRHADGRYFAG